MAPARAISLTRGDRLGYFMRGMIAGIDLGGTQVRVALARSDGQIVFSARTRTALLGSPERLVEWVVDQIPRRDTGEPLRGAAIGAPGPIDKKNGILINPPNLPGWSEVPLAAMLSEPLGCPVYVENDANVAAVGEFHRGAGRGSQTMVYITWSTGVGGGLILDGQLFSGAHGTAGEIGHMVLDPNGPLDSCGQHGCLEAFCGGGSLSRQTGESTAELFQAAAAGDHEAAEIVGRAASYMGHALVSLTNLVDPEVIVIGGGISRSWKQVAPVFMSVLRGSPFIKPARRPRVRRSRLGDRAGQVGAVEWARTHP
jgi:glucokinase